MTVAKPIDVKNLPPGRNSLWKGLLRDRSFVAAVVILGLTATVWPFTISALHWAQEKTPIAWPRGARDGQPWAVEVSEDFRWTNLPTRLGKYVQGSPYPNSNGEIVLPKETRDILGVGRFNDAPRRATRSSNWYVSRIYEDPGQSQGSPFKYWQLDVIYYTGSAEKVEHVPDRCMLAGGFVPFGPRVNVSFASDGIGSDWPKDHQFVRAGFTRGGDKPTPKEFQVVEYYTFVLNGVDETSWERVRLHMATTPWEKHCYFAKIQFTPLGYVSDLAACDRAAQSFVNAFLPEVLRALPTRDAVQRLNSGRNHK
jgi:hypothetical protein